MARTSKKYSKLTRQLATFVGGASSTRSISESRKEGAVYSCLREILDPISPGLDKFSLSETAGDGVIDRAERRGKPLPWQLLEALRPSNDDGPDHPPGAPGMVAGFPYKQGHKSETFAFHVDQSPTLTAMRPDSAVLIELPYVAGFKYKPGAKARGLAYEKDKAPTLVSGVVDTAVLIADMRHVTIGDVSQTLTAGGAGISLNVVPCLLTRKAPIYTVRTDPRQLDLFGSRQPRWKVRRLTPRECLALQGFHKTWLDGVMFTPQGRKEARPLSDAQIYKLAGNSQAVPCVRNIIEGLVAMLCEEENPQSMDIAA